MFHAVIKANFISVFILVLNVDFSPCLWPKKPSILPFYKAGIDSHSIEKPLIAHTSLNTRVFIHQSNNKWTIIDIFRLVWLNIYGVLIYCIHEVFVKPGVLAWETGHYVRSSRTFRSCSDIIWIGFITERTPVLWQGDEEEGGHGLGLAD